LVSLDEKATSNLFDELTYDIRVDELENRLPEMLGKLNFDELQLIQLRFFESRSFKEVGDIVGISEGNAKVKTYRAVGKIRKMFLKE
jgi:RNA polymerase sigma-70 factor (ECF subfamily)